VNGASPGEGGADQAPLADSASCAQGVHHPIPILARPRRCEAVRECLTVSYSRNMNTKLKEELKSIRVEEVESAMNGLVDDTIAGKRSACVVRSPQIAERFPGFAPLLEFEPDDENPALGAGKIEGYRFAICLIAAVADHRECTRLRDALAAITADEMMDAFCKVFDSDIGDLVNYLVKQSKRYPGYCQGSSTVFSFFNEDNRLDTMAIGHTIFSGTLLRIADAGKR